MSIQLPIAELKLALIGLGKVISRVYPAGASTRQSGQDEGRLDYSHIHRPRPLHLGEAGATSRRWAVVDVGFIRTPSTDHQMLWET